MNEQIFPVFWICYYIWQQVCSISKRTSTLIVHIVKYYFISDTAQKLLWVNGFSVSLDVIPVTDAYLSTMYFPRKRSMEMHVVNNQE